MSREGIIDQLYARAVTVGSLLYSRATVSKYIGEARGAPAVIKVVHIPPGFEPHDLEKECAALLSISHPNSTAVLDSFWVRDKRNSFLVTVSEHFENSLDKDTTRRKEKQDLWTEDELMQLAKDLISALAYLQSIGCAHKDIAPETIFLTPDRKGKLGDCVSARYFPEEFYLAAFTGTPLYLSPKMKQRLMDKTVKVDHNPYKSDVYSLGLTLLTLAKLDTPSMFSEVETPKSVLEEVLRSLPYSDRLKAMIRLMLVNEESERCDFVQLNQVMNRETATQRLSSSSAIVCAGCGSTIDVSGTKGRVVKPCCDRPQHMFCSRACFQSIGSSTDSGQCPLCRNLAAEEIKIETKAHPIARYSGISSPELIGHDRSPIKCASSNTWLSKVMALYCCCSTNSAI